MRLVRRSALIALFGVVYLTPRCLRVRCCEQRYPFVVVYNDAKWNLEKRFSDFAELDSALEEATKNDEIQVRPSGYLLCCETGQSTTR